MHITFPESFLWGTATASYQVEGAVTKEGRKRSIWDDFCEVPGAIAHGDDGSVAADQYHRYPEDIAIMEELGIQSYRFSLAWPRIIPDGIGEVNTQAIEHYRRVMHALHHSGINVTVTLYHWDLPSALERTGGWRNRQTVEAFSTYAETCFHAFGDLVDAWITINEPWCIAYLGHATGEHAPGHRNPLEVAQVVHHVNLAHGMAVSAYRRINNKDAIGIAWNVFKHRSASRKREDILAAEKALMYETRIFTDPVLHGSYPKALPNTAEWQFPIVGDDMEIIQQPIDFIGVNYYHETVVKASASDPRGYETVQQWEERTSQNWPINPRGLLRILRWIDNESHHLPLYITENGCAVDDVISEDQRVHDHKRIEYLSRHMSVCAEALEEGIPLKGFYVWSFIDNFEWAWGYEKRFGIVYCNYKNQQRIIKDSGYFLRDTIAGYCEI